jgi:hypothetical protein
MAKLWLVPCYSILGTIYRVIFEDMSGDYKVNIRFDPARRTIGADCHVASFFVIGE